MGVQDPEAPGRRVGLSRRPPRAPAPGPADSCCLSVVGSVWFGGGLVFVLVSCLREL